MSLSYMYMYTVLCSPSLQRAVAAITAHDSPLAALAFNSVGTKLATASTTVRGNTLTHSLTTVSPLPSSFAHLDMSFVYSEI